MFATHSNVQQPVLLSLDTWVYRSVMALALCSLIASSAFGHSRWIVPTHTVLSGDEAQQVTVDVSVSNDIFHPDMPFGGPKMERSPLQNAKPMALQPDGTTQSPQMVHLGRKSAFDVDIEQDGTYGIEVATEPIAITTWKIPGAERGGRAFGTREQAAERIPQNATDVSTRHIHTRIVTWVTRNNPTPVRLSGQGLELSGAHPNDLFTGEPLELGLLVDGKPAPEGTSASLTLAGTRHRNDRQEIHAETDSNGELEVQLSQPGLYLLEVHAELSSADQQTGDRKSYSLFATLEVQPE